VTSDSLGDRMKGYESVWATQLPGRMPVILRLDGKAFHSYTRDLSRPWCPELSEVMDITAQKLCQEIQGAQIAYVQSDEISILVHGYKTFESQPWFDGKIQKMVSVSAAIASATFTSESWRLRDPGDSVPNKASLTRPAYFDSRVYVLPESEVCNAFLWRQQDATRNSIQMLARSLYSHKELDHKNTAQLQELCFQKGQNWNDIPTRHKRGRCIVKETYTVADENVTRTRWAVDNEIPVFSQDRDYLNRLLALEEG